MITCSAALRDDGTVKLLNCYGSQCRAIEAKIIVVVDTEFQIGYKDLLDNNDDIYNKLANCSPSHSTNKVLTTTPWELHTQNECFLRPQNTFLEKPKKTETMLGCWDVKKSSKS